MNTRHVILVAFLCCLMFKASGQQTFAFSGTIYKKSSPDRLAQALITNLRTNTIMMSDELGGFTIPSAIGDTLFIKKAEYLGQICVVTSQLDINIYLQPVVMLKEVEIKEVSRKQEIKDAMDQYKSQGQYATLKPSTWAFITSPLTSLYEVLGEDPNRARKFLQRTKEDAEQIEINRRYNRPLIKKVTGLTDDKEVDNFTRVFTPIYDDIKTWSDYDVIKYIKNSYEWYKIHKDELNLQPLNFTVPTHQ